MKRYIILLIAVFNINIFSQEIFTSKSNSEPIPNFSLSSTIGAIEGFSFSFGKYLNEEILITVKWAIFGVKGHVEAGASIGIGGNYYFDKVIIFKYLSADYLSIYGSGYNGSGYELVLGTCTNSKNGFGFIFEIGVGYSDVIAKFSYPVNERKTLFGPIVKIGANFNF